MFLGMPSDRSLELVGMQAYPSLFLEIVIPYFMKEDELVFIINMLYFVHYHEPGPVLRVLLYTLYHLILLQCYENSPLIRQEH